MSHDLTPWSRSAGDVAVDPWIDAETAVRNGRYGVARQRLQRLASESPDDEVRIASRALLRRMAPDPMPLMVWGVLVCLILGLLVFYVSP
jgi:hypothetical protein